MYLKHWKEENKREKTFVITTENFPQIITDTR